MDPVNSLAFDRQRLYNIAFALALFTIFYNLLEGIVSIWFGYEDESLALFGFGTDSFVEVISGLGIAHMVLRVRQNSGNSDSAFEKTALRITGISFYLLTAGLAITSVYNVIVRHKPETTFWGVVISIISIIMMALLIAGKIRIGKRLESDAVLADAECTKVCLYMSVILLISSAIYELTEFIYIDSIGTLGLAWFSFREGRECFEKLKKHN